MFDILAPLPAPEPRSDADLRSWTLAQIRKPAVTAEDFRLRKILNNLLSEMEAQS